MEIAFYLAAIVAVLTTIRVITHTNPVHALLYLIVSLIAIAMVFFSLGAYFAGALEIIVYAGAIMVLFVFVMMMLNLGHRVEQQERQWLQPRIWLGPVLVNILLLALLIYTIDHAPAQAISGAMIDAKQVGIQLFGPYVLAVELASMLLLAGLVVAYHLGRDERQTDKATHVTSANSSSTERLS